MKRFLFGFTMLFLSNFANAANYQLVTASGVDESSDSRAVSLQGDFLSNSKVYAFLTISGLAPGNKDLEGGRSLEARWYSCENNLVYKRNIFLNKLYDKSSKSNGDGAHHVWFWLDAAVLGSGGHKVEVYRENALVASTKFNVRDASGQPSGGCAVQAQTFTLSDEMQSVLFDFDSAVLSPAGVSKVESLLPSLRSYKSVESLEIVGHTDSFGNAMYNQSLSKRRAETVKNVLLNGGVSARNVFTTAKGGTEPVSSCASGTRSQRIACNAVNRRVEIKVAGVR
jgi:outer membrane protein OmpA-like peptidoglycan-associated protein